MEPELIEMLKQEVSFKVADGASNGYGPPVASTKGPYPCRFSESIRIVTNMRGEKVTVSTTIYMEPSLIGADGADLALLLAEARDGTLLASIPGNNDQPVQTFAILTDEDGADYAVKVTV